MVAEEIPVPEPAAGEGDSKSVRHRGKEDQQTYFRNIISS